MDFIFSIRLHYYERTLSQTIQSFHFHLSSLPLQCLYRNSTAPVRFRSEKEQCEQLCEPIESLKRRRRALSQTIKVNSNLLSTLSYSSYFRVLLWLRWRYVRVLAAPSPRQETFGRLGTLDSCVAVLWKLFSTIPGTSR